MFSRKKLYITTTLPYASAKAHIGHAFEFIIADALSRFFKSELGECNVFFNTGLDEHGSKIYEKAKGLQIDTKSYVDGLTGEWKDFCELFHIKYDSFYKTSEKEHHKKVRRFWNECVEKGEIYKKNYRGKYCVGCESFKTDAELAGGICPDHANVPIRETEEENYFFRLSKYKGVLEQWISKNPSFLSPSSKLTELENIIRNSEDISVSRLKKNLPWGVGVPNDPEHIIYVWADALLNYVFSCGYYVNEKEFSGWWENTVQVCGPDNLRFQAVILQSMLCSAGINQTGKLLVHGTILDENGKKMSKTLGNTIDPIEQLGKFGLDAVRLYALAGISTYSDGCWSEKELVELYNSRLSHSYGNLITRSLHLVETRNSDIDAEGSDTFRKYIDGQTEMAKSFWKDYKIREALNVTAGIVEEGNKYFNDSKPWETQNVNYSNELSDIYYLLQKVTDLYRPVIPNRYDEIIKCLNEKKKVVLFPKIEIKK